VSEDQTQPGFSPAQIRTLTSALDGIIPPSQDRGLPGAGEVATQPLADRSAETAPALAPGLDALDAAARERGAADYASLPPAVREAVLHEVAQALPAFPPTLLFLASTAYYQDARVLTALGLEARAPHPQGYELEAGDLSGLERVKARGRLYRET